MGRDRVYVDRGHPEATVVLNWNGTPEQEFRLIAEAYHMAGQRAAAALRENPYFGLNGIPIEDFHAYPVLFLYRHALELFIKAIILDGSPMLSLRGLQAVDCGHLSREHSLDWLRQQLERIFEAYGWGWDLGTPHLRSIEDWRKTVAELDEIDKGSYAFRYPVDRMGNASLPSSFRFDLFEFCEILDELLTSLQGAAIGAREELVAAQG